MKGWLNYNFNVAIALFTIITKSAYSNNTITFDWNAIFGVQCDFPGNDLYHINSNLYDCIVECDKELTCTHATYSFGVCHLKLGPIDRLNVVRRENYYCYIKNKSIVWHDNWANNCDFPRNNKTIVANINALGEECGYLCDRNRKCTHSVWQKITGNGTCTLISGRISKDEAIFNSSVFTSCAFASNYALKVSNCSDGQICTYDRIDWRFEDFGHGCEYRGNDFMAKKTNDKECGQECALQPGCSHYTWSLEDGGVCFMKKGGPVLKDTAIVVNDLATVCGIVDYAFVRETCNLEGAASIGFDLKTVYPGKVCKAIEIFIKPKHLRLPFSAVSISNPCEPLLIKHKLFLGINYYYIFFKFTRFLRFLSTLDFILNITLSSLVTISMIIYFYRNIKEYIRINIYY